LVAENGGYLAPKPEKISPPRSTMNLSFRPENDLKIASGNGISERRIRVIEIVPRQIVTRERIENAKIANRQVIADPSRDILKLVVVERHRGTGNVGVGFVRGFGLTRGALGSTVAHDAHNVVVVGANDDDIISAVGELERMRGGQVAILNREVEDALPLPIAGLVSDQPLEAVIEQIEKLNAAAGRLGCKLPAPFMSLSFMTLSPIPELKLTDQGLVDAVNLQLTSVFAD
jgi:adenine deaminase